MISLPKVESRIHVSAPHVGYEMPQIYIYRLTLLHAMFLQIMMSLFQLSGYLILISIMTRIKIGL